MATMPTAPQDVLNKGQLAAINKALADVNKAIGLCDQAEGCGIDCSDRRQRIDDARVMIEAIKAEYFPGAK